ncbi:MAG: ABC transporter permease [Eubacteriales bacterium]|nr:ABC transporter permease [Eubacteriales bacterium]
MASMQRPLSIQKYVFSNKKKTILVTAIAILGVVLLFLSKGIIQSIEANVVRTWALPFKEFSIEKANADNRDAEDIVVEKIYMTGTTGRISSYAFFTSSAGMEQIIELNQVDLLKGNYPKAGSNEIVVHKNIAINQGWTVGSVIGSDLGKNDSLNGEFLIVGLIDADGLLSIGSIEGLESVKGTVERGKLVSRENATQDDAADLLYSYESELSDIDDYGYILVAIMAVLLIVIVLVTTISISFLLYLFYIQRSAEFGILMAIGYSKNWVARRSIFEIIYTLIISLLIGSGLSIIILEILNLTVFMPMGQPLDVFKLSYLKEVLLMILMVLVFSAIPIQSYIKKIDPIDVVEGGM